MQVQHSLTADIESVAPTQGLIISIHGDSRVGEAEGGGVTAIQAKVETYRQHRHTKHHNENHRTGTGRGVHRIWP